MKDFDEILIKLQDEVEAREMEEEVRSGLLVKACCLKDEECHRKTNVKTIYHLSFVDY